MQDKPIRVVSLNINGVLNPVKRWKMLSQLKKDKVQIAFIQESHLDDTEHSKLNKMGFKKIYFSSHCSGKRRGVAILLSSTVNFEYISEYKDNAGKYVMVSGKINGVLVSLLNVYIPPGSDWSIYKHLFDIMSTKSQGMVICGGDFNMRLHPRIDSSNGKPDNRNISKRINLLMKELGIVDTWRELNPTGREYTHYSAAHNVYSRIDYFFMFKNDLFRAVKCEIGVSTLSDHNPVYLSLHLNNNPRITLWSLNTNILKDNVIKEKLKSEIRLYLELNDNGEVSPSVLWDALKAVIRGKIIAISSMEKKLKTQKLKDLKDKLMRLQKDHSKSLLDSTKAEINIIKSEIDEINTQEIQKKLLFTKQLYYDTGGKALKLLSYRLRKQQAEKTIYKIRNPNTKNIETDPKKIKQCFEEYYQKLYSQPQLSNNNQIDTFLSSLNLPTVSDTQNQRLTSKITKEEVQAAIKRLKTGKSPGADGFNSEWYKNMQEELIPTLLKAFNWVMEKKIIPTSWSEAIISIIPKENKDKLECGNYRPISVLNTDYKLFTSILSKRLETILPDLINTDQTGFIRQRQTLDNIRKTLHIMKHAKQNNLEIVLLSLDAEKAFDSVRWAFLYKVLSKFGFHPNIVDTFAALYSKPTARVKVNADLTNTFTLQRGTRQGCGASPLLFALFLEPLAQWIRQRPDIKGVIMASGEHKLALFADDVLMYLTQPNQTLPRVMTGLEEYGSVSGYKININKTQILSLNYNPTTEIKNRYNWEWESNHIKYLGVILTKDLSKLFEANYGPLTHKIKSDLQRWNSVPFLDLYSRVESIRMNILPRMLYLFQCLPIKIPQKHFDEWDRLIAKYLWQHKRARIKYKTLQLLKEKGGMGLPCLKEYYLAAQLKPLVCLNSPSYSAGWKEIEVKVLKFPIMAILTDIKLQKTTTLAEDFIFDSLLNSWNKSIKKCKLGELLKILRWCAYDSEFAPNTQDDAFKRWIPKGLTTYFSFTRKGVFSSFETLQKKHGLAQNDFYRYLQVRHYFNDNLKAIFEKMEPGFLQIFLSFSELKPHNNIISRLYKGIQQSKHDSTESIKKKWENEGNMTISKESWTKICQLQWTTTGSNTWREFSWRNIIRYFITPIQKRHLGSGDACWRQCGTKGANHYHIFWDCQVITSYWKEIGEHVNNIFGAKIPLKCETMYLGDVPGSKWSNGDKRLLNMLLVASKKAITRKWWKVEPPTTEDWINIVHDIYVMEKLSFSLRMQKDRFYEIWTKWTEYMKPLRMDFL